jgi:hypothetical protein
MGWGRVRWIRLPHHRNRWRAFVNTVMKILVLAPRIYRPNVQLHNILRVIKSRSLRCDDIRGGDEINAVAIEKREGKNNLKDLSVDIRIILKCVRNGCEDWIKLARDSPLEESCEYWNELSDYIRR